MQMKEKQKLVLSFLITVIGLQLQLHLLLSLYTHYQHRTIQVAGWEMVTLGQ